MSTIAPLMLDFYKLSHPIQYPKGTEFIYSNVTPRKSRIPEIDSVVVFGFQYFVKKYLIDVWGEWFKLSKHEAIGQIRDVTDDAIGPLDLKNYEALWRLGYLPVHIKTLDEGSLCPIGVPFMTIENTQAEFYWVTNMLETLTQTVIWQPITSATIAFHYRKLLTAYARETGNEAFVPFQGHDFSMRGMSSPETGAVSGAAHLLSFVGTDTVPAICLHKDYYDAVGMVGCSVPATEHSVACAGATDGNDFEYLQRMLEVYPSGIVSVVADTYDLWTFITGHMVKLREQIMSRNGKLVVRPDSGDPVKIVCGDSESTVAHIQKGVVELLWDKFGGTVNAKGYKELDPHVGVIYGDSITIERAKAICEGLKAKGFASTNIVFGIGSYTYNYVTRDTFSIACKATWACINGVGKELYKDPITDDGTKKSAKGLLYVHKVGGKYALVDQVSRASEQNSCLTTLYENGVVGKYTTTSQIRNRLLQHLED